jgi:hypothetical protein
MKRVIQMKLTDLKGLKRRIDAHVEMNVAERKKRKLKESQFDEQRKHLRMMYKLWKAGLIKEGDIPIQVKRLLNRYYGCEFCVD